MSTASRKRVLIVEDDAATQRLLEAVLHRGGFATEVAADGALAIEKLRTGRWDLIVLDVMMPNVGGHGVIEFLASNAIDTPVVVCTAAGPRVTREFDAGVVKAVVRKPFDIQHLIETVGELTGGGAAARPRVLIVDDDTRARYVMRAFIDNADTFEASSAEQALQMIGEARPDVVLLDLILPGRSGEELLAELRANDATASLPVVVVTSRKLEAEDRNRLLSNATGILYKGDLSRGALAGALHVILCGRGLRAS